MHYNPYWPFLVMSPEHKIKLTLLTMLFFFNSCRKAGLDLLIRIKIPDAPTLFPLPEPHQHRKSYEPVDFDKLIEERCEP